MLKKLKRLLKIVILFSLVSCSSTQRVLYIVEPEQPSVIRCMILPTNSLYCVNKNMQPADVFRLINDIKLSGNIKQEMKNELVSFFDENMNTIVDEKEFELPLKYLPILYGTFVYFSKDKKAIDIYIEELKRDWKILKNNCEVVK